MFVQEKIVPGCSLIHLAPGGASGAAKKLAARAIAFGDGAADSYKHDRCES
jgi:hypothetical protein